MENGVSRLHREMTKHIKRVTAYQPPMDLGTMQSDLSLKLDHFDRPIADYLACAGVTLYAGDRVLAAWVGADAVIIDKVVT